MEGIMKTLLQVRNGFEQEYSFLLDKFNILELDIKDAMRDGTEEVNSPGVYVFWTPLYGVVKVGKSQSNSKKRSLQHIHENTRNDIFEMKLLEDDSTARLLLFNIKTSDNKHWVLSLEAFMEWNMEPAIPAGRMG